VVLFWFISEEFARLTKNLDGSRAMDENPNHEIWPNAWQHGVPFYQAIHSRERALA
jgi:hypothetical protein